MSEDIVLGILAVVGGALGSLALEYARARINRPVSQSEVAHNYADAAESTAAALASMAGRLSALEAAVDAQQKTISKWHVWAGNVVTAFNVVTAQLRELGQEPRATIPPLPDEAQHGS